MSDDHIVQASVVERDLLSTRWSLFADIRIAATAGLRDVQIVGLVCSWSEGDAVASVNSGLVLNSFHTGQNDVVLACSYFITYDLVTYFGLILRLYVPLTVSRSDIVDNTAWPFLIR